MTSAVVKNQKDASDSVGIGERQFQRWIKEGCPGKENGVYTIVEIVKWVRNNKWVEGDSDEDAEEARLHQELRNEKLRYEINLKRFEIDKKLAKVVPIEPVEDYIRDFAARLRNALETVQKRHGTDAISPVVDFLDRSERELDEGAFDRLCEQ